MKAGDTIQVNGERHTVRRVHTPAEMIERMPSMRPTFEGAAADGCTRVALLSNPARNTLVLIETAQGWETFEGQRPLIVMANPPPGGSD
jgi:hypothetical protein